MSRNSKLSAVDHVNIEAPPGIEDQLQWFYGELIGLKYLQNIDPAGDAETLVFRSERLRLVIRICHYPEIEPVAHRLTCVVSSLEETAGLLDERRHSYNWIKGLQFTDRALSLQDPAGNRVMLRRWWSSALI